MNAIDRARRVRLMVFDVDGVLTDGRLYYGAGGEALKAFDVKDGHGIKLLAASGVTVAWLTARNSEIVAQRARELGVTHLLQGRSDKLAGFRELLSAGAVAAEQAGYAGDDLPDLPVLASAGFAATVADAVGEVKSVAHWIAPAAGGRGAARAIAEFVMRAQTTWERALGDGRRGAQS
jgi:3-deoxy-D-manno-octulosonate 8-phosphate phosphatase (KDO 8-P phosphatase)